MEPPAYEYGESYQESLIISFTETFQVYIFGKIKI